MNDRQTGFRFGYGAAESPGKGLGVFAREPIRKGSVVWRHVPGVFVVYDETSFRARLEKMSPSEVVYELTHVHAFEDFPGCLIRALDDGILMQLDDQVKRVDEWQTHRMPLHMAQRFSWDNLKDARTPKGTATRRVAADCPAGTSLPPCSTTTVGLAKFPFEVTFQADGMPAQIKIKDEKIRFQYGGFAMRRPPGW